jgi:predicted transcriptional regulator
LERERRRLMSKRGRLTPVEWEIMEAVWGLGGSPSVREVLEHAFPKGEKAYTTVQTILNTLEKKGMLARKKVGLVNFYRPTRSRDDVVRAEMSSIVSRVFGGSIPALAHSLLSLKKLDTKEIDEIKAIVARKEREMKEEKR